MIRRMDTGPDTLRNSDWDRTFHAYGCAADLPGALAAVLSGDAVAFGGALDHLYGAVLHQGTVYPATAPAALFLAGGLGLSALDTVVEERVSGPITGRVVLLEFLAGAALASLIDHDTGTPAPAPVPETERDRVIAMMRSEDEEEAIAAWDEPVVERLMLDGLADMRAAAPALADAVRPFLTHPDRSTRIRAVEAAAALCRLGAGTPDLSGAADLAECRDEGAVIVLALGDIGEDTTEFLSHADPVVRVCAALAPALRNDPAALAELRSALTDPDAVEAWFTTPPSLFALGGRDVLVEALAASSNATRAVPDPSVGAGTGAPG